MARCMCGDGKFWTAAGVTAGIDLSLAVIEEDFGSEVALSVARELVVGGQDGLFRSAEHTFNSATHC
ncbi:MAG: hypothetical protein WBW98_03050 [Candidatus Sulfotelmatobacter sp.]